jgi:hypothetical protein
LGQDISKAVVAALMLVGIIAKQLGSTYFTSLLSK